MNPELEGGPAHARVQVPVPHRAVLLIAMLTASFLLAGLQFAGAARADSSQLCAGYAACATAPYTTHRYENAAGTSWWSMYPGVNCTNYAAFVESQVYGVPAPGVLMGDAYEWAGG